MNAVLSTFLDSLRQSNTIMYIKFVNAWVRGVYEDVAGGCGG